MNMFLNDNNIESKSESELELESKSDAEPESESKQESKSDAEPESESKQESKSDAEPEPKSESKQKSKSESDAEPKSKPESESDAEPESKQESDAETDSDTDEYVDLSSCINDDNLKHIFQFHLTNEKLFLKYIGKSSDTPDIIIMENFGQKSNLSLYNCVYSHNELETIKNTDGEINNKIIVKTNKDEQIDNLEYLRLFFPLIKLIIKEEDNIITSSIAIKLNQEIVYENEIINWSLYWVENSNTSDYIKILEIQKDINPTNIIEKIIHYSLHL